jgi:ubiquitin C-terminal hydrolase
MPNALYQQNSSGAFFLDSFAHIFSELHSKRAVCPSWFLHDAPGLSPRFRHPYQEDAHEFLVKLLSRFDEECRRTMRGSSEQHPTFVSRYFRWEIAGETSCKHCGYRHTTVRYLTDCPVPVIEGGIIQATRELTASRAVLRSSGCDQCGQTDCVMERSHVQEYPLILMVTLLRFDAELRKIDDFVTYPDRLTCGGGAYNYQLYAIIVHEGKLSTHGHFVAFVRDQNDDWYKADDLCVFKAKLETVMSSRPYVLFYKLIM